MDEMQFYNHEAVAELAATIGVSAQDTLKYIFSNYAMQDNKEDFQYFEDKKLMAAFRLLRDNCLEFVQAYDYYNFTNSTPYPIDKESFEVITERGKAYREHLAQHNQPILTYDDSVDYYDLIEE